MPWGPALAAPIVAAVTEEILMRAILFRILEEATGSVIALVVSAVVFGALHGWNPGATVTNTMAIALEAGVLLAAVYMVSRRLWMPIGLHLAWNYAEGGVFGANVSGAHAPGFFLSHFSGPELLSGGAFGPEASVVAVAVCLVGGVSFLVVAKRWGHVVAPRWRR